MPGSYEEYLNVLGQPREAFWGLSKRQKRFLLFGTLGGAGLYFLYKAYRSDTLQALIELRKQFSEGIGSYGEAFALSSELSKQVVTDLHAFLNSDEDKLPQSLKQLAKLARSEEVARAASKFAEAAATGMMSAFGASAGQQDGQDMLNRVLEALTIDKGSNLVSLAVSMACRSTVQAYCEFGGSSGTSGPGFWQQLLEFGTTPKGEQLYMNCAGTLIREGAKVYMGSLEGVSGWEDFLNSLCKPERALAIDRMTRAFVNELVVSYLRKTRYGVRPESKHSKAVKSEKGSYQPLSPDTAHSNLEGLTADPGCCASVQLKPRKTVSFDNIASPAIFPGFGSVSDWSSAMIQMSKHAEIRALIVSVAKTATGESIRSSLFTVKDLITGKRSSSDAAYSAGSVGTQLIDVSKMNSRSLGAMFLAIFMPLIAFLAGRRSGIEG